MRWSEHRRFVRFVFAAGASVPLNIAARIAFSQVVSFGVAVLMAHVVGMVAAYTLTRVFVFEPSGRSVRSELSRFALVNLVSASITWVVSVGLDEIVFPTIDFRFHPELFAHISGLAVSAVTSFIGHRHFSFGSNRRSS